MILDFHVHAFPKSLAGRAVVSLSERARVPCCHDGTLPSLKQVLQNADVTHAVLLNIAVKQGQADKVNQFAKDVMAENVPRTPQITSFASLHPFDEDWRETLHTIKDVGFAGIKLHPDYQNFFIDDPRLEPFYREVAKLGLIAVFHAGYDKGYPEPIHATPRRIEQVLPLLEEGTTVLAHMGGALLSQGVLGLLCGRNVYFDTSFVLPHMNPDTAKAIFRRHGPERILFGSDAPWADPLEALHYFRDELAPGFLSETDTRRVLWDNGAALLNLEG